MMLLLILLSLSYCGCSNILGLFPYPGRSHFVVADTLLMELSKRGHNVTVYTCYPKNYTIRNYRDIDMSSCFGAADFSISSKMTDSSIFADMRELLGLIPKFEEISTCRPLLELRDSNDKYDLMITQTLMYDFFLYFAYKFDIPFIGFMPNPPYPWMTDRLGMPNNPSYLTNLGLAFFPKMDFWQRMQNAVLEVYSLVAYDIHSIRIGNEMGDKFFGDVPNLQDLVGKTSLMFFCMDFSYYQPRPMVPSAVDVHGLHIEKKKPLNEVL